MTSLSFHPSWKVADRTAAPTKSYDARCSIYGSLPSFQYLRPLRRYSIATTAYIYILITFSFLIFPSAIIWFILCIGYL